MAKSDKKPEKKKVLIGKKFVPIFLKEEKKNLNEEREKGELEKEVEEFEKEEDLQDFSQFVSGGKIVEIAPNVSQTLVSEEKPVENLEEEFASVGGSDKKEEEEIVKYDSGEKIYQQSDDARAYQESHQGEEVVVTRGIQQGSELEQGRGLSPMIDTHVGMVRVEGMSRERSMEDVVRGNYLSASEIENEREVHKIERRKYEI